MRDNDLIIKILKKDFDDNDKIGDKSDGEIIDFKGFKDMSQKERDKFYFIFDKSQERDLSSYFESQKKANDLTIDFINHKIGFSQLIAKIR